MAAHRTPCIEHDASSFIDQCVVAYLELAGVPATKLSAKAATPLIDETNAFTKDEPEGKLANIALKVPLKILLRSAMLPTRSSTRLVLTGQKGH